MSAASVPEPRPWTAAVEARLPVAAALTLEALILVTLPGFLALRAPIGWEAAFLGAGALLGHLAAGELHLSPRRRLQGLGVLLGAVAAAWPVATWRSPAARHLLAALGLQMRFLVISWRAGALPPVPLYAGLLLLLLGGAAVGAVVAAAVPRRSPLPAVGVLLGFLALEWEFVDLAAARLWWPAAACGLVWIASDASGQRTAAAASAGDSASPEDGVEAGAPAAAWRGGGRTRPAAALRAAATAVVLVMAVAHVPLNRPPGDVGGLATWVSARLPFLDRLTAGMRLRAATAPLPLGFGAPLAPTAPYSIGQEGFGAGNNNLGGPLTDSGAEALRIGVVSGTPPPTLYLRGLALDTYTGRGWVETPDNLRTAPPPYLRPFGFGAIGAAAAGGSPFRLRVQVTGLVTSTLFTVLDPLRLSGVPAVWDRLGNAWAGRPLAPGTSYQVDAIAPRSPAQLAAEAPAAGYGGYGFYGGYGPYAGFYGRYRRRLGTAGAGGGGFGYFGLSRQLTADMQLPPSLPLRVRTLATAWSAGAATPLQKALALQAHLLRIPYSLDAPAPPPGRDFVDFFLFTAHEGYCTYYASALAVMLRAVGIPSRWVVGFAVPTPPRGQTAVVSDSQAHAWVEAFIRPYGWLAFDPTPPGPTLRTPASGAASTVPLSSTASSTGSAASVPAALSAVAGLVGVGAARLGAWGDWAAAVLLALALGAAAALRIRWRQRWDASDPLGSATRLWGEVERMARGAGVRRPPPGLTPAELARRLAGPWPHCAPALQAMATAYGRCRFGPPEARPPAALAVRAAWPPLEAAWRREATAVQRLRTWLALR